MIGGAAPAGPQVRPSRQAPAVTRSWASGDRAPGPPPEPVAWPLVAPTAVFVAVALAAALVPDALQEPLVLSIRPIEPVVGVMGTAFVWFILATIREEARLNARGETLFLEKRPNRRGALRRADRALSGAVEGLLGGGDAPGVLRRLKEATHAGDALQGRARLCYDVAERILEGGRDDWVEAARWLDMARDELRKELR